MVRTQGIVIRTTDYREKDKIMVIFTPTGIVTVTARGVRSAESKLKPCAQIPAFGEFTYGGRKNNVLTGGEITDNFFSAWTDVKKIAALMTCFELTEKCFSKDDETAGEFVFLLRTVNEIVYGQSSPLGSAMNYAVYCAERMGVEYFEISEYDGKSYEIISAYGKSEPEEAGTLPFTEESVKRALSMLHNVFSNYLNIKIQTLKMLLKEV